jgi:uncharacterized coiled-coil DUF342 family protein
MLNIANRTVQEVMRRLRIAKNKRDSLNRHLEAVVLFGVNATTIRKELNAANRLVKSIERELQKLHD